MTSLSLQLQRLKTSSSTTPPQQIRKRASLLFDSNEAATIPLDAIFNLGSSGLDELCSLNESFIKFRETLFNENYLGTSRGSKTKAFNTQLTHQISQYLYLASPYFLLKPTVKSLEWLVRKYEIHKFEAEVILSALLPYHETRLFGRFLQILDMSKYGNRWSWLEPIIKKGNCVSKLTLSKRIRDDMAFLQFVISMPENAESTLQDLLETPDSSKDIKKAVAVIRSFSVSSVMTLIESAMVLKEDIIGILIPNALKNLTSKSEQSVISGYVVIGQLAQKVSFNEKIKEACLKSICMSLDGNTQTHGLLCLSTFVKFQGTKTMQDSCLQILVSLPALVFKLSEMSTEHDISALLCTLSCEILFASLTTTEDATEEKGSVEHRLLINLVKELEFPMHIAFALARKMLEIFISYKKEELNVVPSFSKRLREVAELLGKRHPSLLDQILKLFKGELLADLSKKQQKMVISEFNKTIFFTSDTKDVQESSPSLFLSLNHASADIRMAAILFLIEGASSGKYDLPYASEQLLTRLQDDDQSIVSTLLGCGEDLASLIEPEVLFKAILDLCYKGKFDESVRTKVSLVYLAIVKRGKMLKPDLDFILFVELLSQSLSCLEMDSRLHLKHVSTALQQTGCEWGLWKSLNASCGQIDWEVFNGDDETLKMKYIDTLLCNLAKDMVALDNCIEMLDSILAHAGKGDLNFSPLWLVNIIISKMIRRESQPSLDVVNFALKHLESSQLKVSRKKHIKVFLKQSSMDEVESAFLSLMRSTKSKNCNLMDVHSSLLLIKSIALFLPRHNQKIGKDASDENLFKCHVRLFRLLCLFGSNKSTEGGALVQVYRHLLQEYFKAQFPEQDGLLGFLFNILDSFESLAWCLGSELSTQATEASLFALHVSASALSSLKAEAPDSTLLWQKLRVLLIYLMHPSQIMREAAISCFLRMQQLLQLSKKGEVHDIFLKSIVDYKEEIIAESNRICTILGKFFRPLRKQKSDTDVEDSKKIKRRTSILASLLATDTSHVFYALQYILREVSCKDILQPAIEETERLASEGKTRMLTGVEVSCLLFAIDRLGEVPIVLPALNNRLLNTLLDLMLFEHPKKYISSIQEAVIAKLNDSLMNKLEGFDQQMLLVSSLVDFMLKNQNIEISKKVKHALNKLPLTHKMFTALFERAFAGLEEEGPKNPKRARRSRIVSSADAKLKQEHCWQQILITLEEIYHRPYLPKSENIVSYYFKVLKGCVEQRNSVPSIEYVKQLTMGCLLKVATVVASGKEKASIHSKDFNVELIIGCLRNSEDYHTHQQALRVLGKAAILFPDLVLHNMMAIFTFMGTNVLRQDDSYSFEIIRETVSLVVPALIKLEDPNIAPERKRKHENDIKKIVIEVFADAAPYIPKHRRLTLFSHLANVLGAEENLHLIVSFLLTRAVAKGKQKADDDIPKEDVLSEEFCVTLMSQFHPTIVMAASGKLIRAAGFLMAKDAAANHGEKEAATTEREDIAFLFDPTTHTTKEMRYFIYLAINVASGVLSNADVRKEVQNLRDSDDEEIEKVYLSLLNELLAFIKDEDEMATSLETESTNKFRRAVMHKGCGIIDKIDDYIKFETFIRVFKTLVSNKSSMVQRKAIEIISDKITKVREIGDRQKEEILLLVDILINIIQDEKSNTHDALQSKLMALLALKTFSSRLGAENANKFTSAVPVILACCENNESTSHFKAHAMLCLADFCATFTVHMIGLLQQIMPTVIANMKISNNQKENFVAHSAYSAAIKIMQSIPKFLSPFFPSLINQACIVPLEDASIPSQIQEKVKALRIVIGSQAAPRILLPALDDCFSNLEEHHKSYLINAMEILAESLSKMTNPDTQTHLKLFHSIFIKALAYRSLKQDVSPENLLSCEQSVVHTYCMHVMKLSENSFRPIFWQIFNWATEDSAPVEHLITFFHLCCGIAGRLKSLFLLFAKQVIKTAQTVLEAHHVGKAERMPFQNQDFAEEKSSQLIEFILDCLTKCFMYDRMGFVGKDDFDFILDALVDQVENDLGSTQMFHRRIEQFLAPCIRSFTTVVHDESCWKTLNSRILLKTKDKRPLVRIAALDILAAMQSALRESYASLLPETIPFLAELMEDETVEVEKKCQDVISQIEVNLGESLQKYF